MNDWFEAKIKSMSQSTEQNRARRESTALSSLLKLCLTAAALALGLTASAQPVTTTMNFAVGAMVPDGDMSGLASVQTISTPITNLTDLKVTLKLSGTWNGDLYCFLTHSTGHSVLLNRVGRCSASNLGYKDAGFDVTFDDAATDGDIHVYRLQLTSSQDTSIPGPLTNIWAPDARIAYPTDVLDTDVRSAALSSFNGVDPNGEWVLFVADMEAGDIHMLESWGLEITGDTAPTVQEQSLAQSTETSTGGATLTRTVMSQVRMQVVAATPPVPAVLKGITPGSGWVKLTFSGSANSTYQIQRAAALQDSRTVWTNIGAATTDATGQGTFTDTNPPAGQGYYRTVSP